MSQESVIDKIKRYAPHAAIAGSTVAAHALIAKKLADKNKQFEDLVKKSSVLEGLGLGLAGVGSVGAVAHLADKQIKKNKTMNYSKFSRLTGDILEFRMDLPLTALETAAEAVAKKYKKKPVLPVEKPYVPEYKIGGQRSTSRIGYQRGTRAAAGVTPITGGATTVTDPNNKKFVGFPENAR